MLLSTKDQGLGRRRRSYSHSSVYSGALRARASKISLLSAATTQSSGSNGSNSTVTQESYNKSKAEASRKKRTSKRKKDPTDPKASAMEAVDEETSSEGAQPEAKVDVFAFLVDEGDQEHHKGQQRSSHGHRIDDIPVFDDDDQDHGNTAGSLHSDSGISLDDGSCLPGQAVQKLLLPTLPEESRPGTSSDASIMFKADWKWPDIPKPSHMDHDLSSPSKKNHPAALLDMRGDTGRYIVDPSPVSYTPATPEYSRASSSSVYESLKSKESNKGADAPALPLRQFKAVDNQILLHLQYEIAHLEHDLKEIDVAMAQLNHIEANGTASRRPSWQWNQPHLVSARVEILQRLQLKLKMYYTQLVLSKKVHNICQAARPDAGEMAVLQDLLRDGRNVDDLDLHVITGNEDDFFNHAPHLPQPSGQPCYMPATLVFTNTIIPLLLFKLFASILNRAIVICIMLAMSTCAIENIDALTSCNSPSPRHQGSAHDRKELMQWVLLGAAITTVAALIG